jgi:F-type H+-transporting ATPase subunit a
MLMMMLVTIFLLWWMPRVARKVMTGQSGTSHDFVTKGPFNHRVEVLCVFFRNDIAKPVMGPFTDRFIPFIWTVFFFILINNLLGLFPLLDMTALVHKAFASGDHAAQVMPMESEHAHTTSGEVIEGQAGHVESDELAATDDSHGEHARQTTGFMWFQDLTNPGHSHFHGIGGTATGNIAVTFSLALIAILVVIGSAIKNLGLGGFLHHLTLDAPVALWPLTILLEIIGLIAKPFALMVRLFANMTAGHVMLASLLGFTSMAWNGFVSPPTGSFSIGGFIGFIPLAIGSIVFAVAVGMLEILVAFIQAFVFAFLSAMFISMFLPHEHEHEHAHEHEHGHAEGLPHAPEAAVTF